MPAIAEARGDVREAQTGRRYYFGMDIGDNSEARLKPAQAVQKPNVPPRPRPGAWRLDIWRHVVVRILISRILGNRARFSVPLFLAPGFSRGIRDSFIVLSRLQPVFPPGFSHVLPAFGNGFRVGS